MNSNDKILVSACMGRSVERVPFWFMRQAGRFLPEYRELRSKAKDFLQFCYTPDKASEATLQPIKRFGMDGAIIFSDILVVPHALGVEVWFEEGHGPRLMPVQQEVMLDRLRLDDVTKKLSPVYEALRKTKADMPKETSLIGFVGAPWTLACYVVEGKSSEGFTRVKTIAKESPDFFRKLISLLTDAVILHAKNQIEAGAEIIQLFDSWAGVLNENEYAQWVIEPAEKIIHALKKSYPGVPLIGFPRQSGIKFKKYVEHTQVDVLGIDQSVPLDWIRGQIQPLCTVQGCLNPQLLAGDQAAMLAEAKQIIHALGDKVFVFNLGHGILPHTPVENMQALCEFLRKQTYTS